MKHFLNLTTIILISLAAYAHGSKKTIVKDWKMVSTQLAGEEQTPSHSHLVLYLNKNGTYKITASYEETHYGTYTFKGKELILHDQRLGEDRIVKIISLEEDYLVIENFDETGNQLHFKPVKSKKAYKLSHKEHQLCKTWSIANSSKTNFEGTIFEFHEDHTFVIIMKGDKYPTFSGEWKMSEDHKTLTLDTSDKTVHMEIAITTLHRHELVLDNLETKEHNEFVDVKH